MNNNNEKIESFILPAEAMENIILNLDSFKKINVAYTGDFMEMSVQARKTYESKASAVLNYIESSAIPQYANKKPEKF